MIHLASFDLIILFFILGILASWLGSDLAVPDQVSKFLSIFLLLSLGLKGGHEVRMAEDLSGFVSSFSIGFASCLALPAVLFFALKSYLGVPNASALAASYGSVSAVTFITARGVLESEGIASSGYMVAIMALMEIPAIVTAIYFYQSATRRGLAKRSAVLSVFSSKSVVLLMGGFAIGLSLNDVSWMGVAPVVQGAFKGVLAFFLLDLGVVAQRQLREAWRFKLFAMLIAFGVPLLVGSIALIAGSILGLPHGDRILMAVLVGSASYIAAPATVRSAMPEANPGLYLALPLALTFPMNLLFGIPFYIELSQIL
ncbi:MAG: sodium-dependent bicarbonate transport family permease [Bdellovibrionales bacterium]|mgnify:FL=1|nr:sodium-dependent bicarbonate transport family permease [Bdellovibrionales bacterium]